VSDIRKVWCTQCWWSFTLDVAALERQRVPAIECPDCGQPDKWSATSYGG
jgi:hypothetical protein